MQRIAIRARRNAAKSIPHRSAFGTTGLSYSTTTSPIRAAVCFVFQIHHSRSLANTRQSQAQQKISRIDASTTRTSPFLIDSFGRQHDYLRISLTEKCNLRCTYCMPEDGVPLLPKDNLLTTDEVERVAKLFVENGVRKIRLTGGEPTVRKDLIDVVARLSALKPQIESLGLTSNGVTLRRHLPSLVEAGLTHLNISLDTLDEHKYELMTRRRAFNKVMETLEVAKRLRDDKGLRVKINCVVIKGLNDMEVPSFIELGKKEDLTTRFIEYMPFEKNRWSTSKLVPSSSLLSLVKESYSEGLVEKLKDSENDTTRAWRIRGYKGSFGFISSMTDHFCGTCSRLRVGADGGVKVCLFGPPALSLRPLLRSLPRSPENDLFISQKIGETVWGKKFAHNGLGGMSSFLFWSKIPGEKFKAKRRILAAAGNRRPTPARRHRRKSQNAISANWTAFSLLSPIKTSASHSRLFSTSSFSHSQSTPPSPSPSLSHIDPLTGKASMVDVSSKEITLRTATAKGKIYLNEAAFSLIDFGPLTPPNTTEKTPTTTTMKTKKGDVLTISQLAGLMATKQTSSLIPLCHPLSLSHIFLTLSPCREDLSIEIECKVSCEGKTGVEMEALMGVSVAGLTVFDMCKAVAGKEMKIGEIRVTEKKGGRSGNWKEGERAA
ncbi:hypothetical protein JCM3765_004095 [Sporobolomyces pararoseus]